MGASASSCAGWPWPRPAPRCCSPTVAYGLLTLLLVGGYATVVLGLGQLLGRDSSLVVAAATLAVVDQTMQPSRATLWLRPPA